VDIVVATDLTQMAPWAPYKVAGGIWRTSTGLHVAVKADVGKIGADHHLWLYVATFDPTRGSLSRLRRVDVFPTGVTFETGDIQGIGGSGSELFAACLRSWDGQQRPRNQTLFIGRLDDDAFQLNVDLGWLSGEYDVAHLGWDGEAFAVHAMNNATREVFVTRVSPTGQVVLPLSKYGATPSDGRSYRISTNPISGMSYLFDAPGSQRLVSGHDQVGTPFSWAFPSAFDLIIAGFAPSFAGAVRPGVAADAIGGAWLAWNKDDQPNRAVAHISKEGTPDQWGVISMQSGSRSPAIIASSPKQVWVADSDTRDIWAAELDDGIATAPQRLVTGPYPKGSPNIWGADDLEGTAWNNERWMSFSEPGNIVHVVKVEPDCVYRNASQP